MFLTCISFGLKKGVGRRKEERKEIRKERKRQEKKKDLKGFVLFFNFFAFFGAIMAPSFAFHHLLSHWLPAPFGSPVLAFKLLYLYEPPPQLDGPWDSYASAPVFSNTRFGRRKGSLYG